MDTTSLILSSEQKNRFSKQPDQISNFNIIFHGSHEIPQYLTEAPFRFWMNCLAKDYPTHWHSSTELIMPLENIYTLQIADTLFQLNPGEILFVPSGILHSITAPSSGSRFIFQFETDPLTKIHGFSGIQNIFNTPQIITPETMPGFHKNAQQMVLKMADQYWTSAPAKELRIYATLLQFFADYNECYQQQLAEKNGAEAFTSNSIHRRAITYTLTYISEHYADDLSLDHMASLIGFSKFHFSRLFKTYTGQTFYNYLYQYRIRIAQTLLCSFPPYPITEISLKTGFNSSSSFTRAFKQWTSYTPTEYRKLFQRR